MRSLPRLVPLAAIATLAATAPAAHGGDGVQIVGDPVTYLRQGQPSTALRSAVRLNLALDARPIVAVQTSGGDALGSAVARPLGTNGLCWRAIVRLDRPVTTGGIVVVTLTTADGQTLRDVESVTTLTVRGERRVAPRLGCS